MNEEITTFLNSGLLEKYLIGETTASETEMVETLISNHTEVKKIPLSPHPSSQPLR